MNPSLQEINNLQDEGEQTYYLTKYLLETIKTKSLFGRGGFARVGFKMAGKF